MNNRVIVLGSCGAWPEPGRACSGYVVEHDGLRIVLDLGYGTLPRLLSVLGSAAADGVDALVVTHNHPDHAIDVHGLYRARHLGRGDGRPIPLFAPAGVLDTVVALEAGNATAMKQVFDVHELPPGSNRHGPYPIGPIAIEAMPVPHSVPAVGIRLSCPEFTLAYTGDTGPDAALTDLGRDADLFIVEATDRGQRLPPGTPATGPQHLSAREAGTAAARAGARRLLLTHFWPGNDRDASAAAAAEAFDGEILLAGEGLVIQLP